MIFGIQKQESKAVKVRAASPLRGVASAALPAQVWAVFTFTHFLLDVDTDELFR